jgi:hypothetical protein
MLYCSSSSGEHFDRRARELRQCPSVVEGIIAHATERSEPTATQRNQPIARTGKPENPNPSNYD